MSEEMNRREAKLDEQALEGVSGGSDYLSRAIKICDSCYRDDPNRYEFCENRDSRLAKYMQQNGDIFNYHRCPFYKK